MHIVGILISCQLLCGVAVAQQEAPRQKSPEELREIQARVADWLKTCLADWDKATHMSKSEWSATCERVSADRGKFLIESPSSDKSRTR